MYTTSEAYKTEILKPSRQFQCRITIGDVVLTNDDIVDIILDSPQPSDGYMIGSTTSQSLDLTILNKNNVIFSINQVKVEIGLNTGTEIEYILIGYYNVDDVVKTDYTIKYTCYDNMIKFETPYFSRLGDTPTLAQVVNELVSITGVQFTGSLPAYTVKKLEGFTCREILGYVASLCGGNAVITRDGKFTIVYPADINYSITGSNYIDYKREEVNYKVGKVTCQVKEKEVLSKGSLGTDSMELQFENPWVTDNILQDIYNRLNGFTYLGYTMKWQGDISLDIGDIITVTDVKGVVRKAPILSQKFTYTGGLTSEIGAKGESKNKNSFSSSGSNANKVNRVVTELLLVNEALINKANVTDLTAVSIRTQSLESKTATIESVLAGNIGANNIAAGTITAGSSIIASGAIGSAQISDLDVAKLNAGTLDTTKITIAGANSRLKITGNRLQVFATKADNSLYERVSLGDVNGDGTVYGFRVRGADGNTVLLDETGVKREGITDGSINNAKIGSDANISGTKLDIASVVNSINNGTTTIQSSKVFLNDSTLDVQFSNLNTTVTSQGQSISTNTANISANTSAIALKLDTQTYNSYKSLNDSNITAINNTLTTHSSGISVLQGQIATKVSQTDIDTSIANIKIGGRNLLRGTELKDLTRWINNGGTGTQTLEAGGGYLGSNCLTLGSGSANGRYQYYATELNVDYTIGCWIYVTTPGTSIIGFNQTGKNIDITNAPTGTWIYKTISFKGTGTNLPFYLLTQTAAFKICLVKLEKGTKPSDYTPALEDVQGQIDSATTRITNAETSITQNTNAIALKLDTSIYNSYKTTNDSNITTINSALSSHSSSISVLQGQITTKVTQTDINNSINTISVGTRNLIRNSTFNFGFSSWDGIKTIDSTKLYGNNVVTYSSSSGYTDLRQTIQNLKANTTYTYSVWVKGNGIASIYAFEKKNDDTNTANYRDNATNVTMSGSWTRITKTFTTQIDTAKILFILRANNASTVYFSMCKLAEGTKIDDWSAAQEDFQDQIDSHTTRISSAESKITPDAITNTVFTTTSNQSNVVQIKCLHKDLVYSNPEYGQSSIFNDGLGYRTLRAAGSYVQYTFTGTGVDVYANKTNDSCIMEVFLDGVSKGTIDLYSSAYVSATKVYSISGLSNTSHTIKLVDTGTKNASAYEQYLNFHRFDITVPDKILTASNMSSVFKQSANNVQMAFNDISPNVALSDSGEFDIINGSLRVKNNNAEVVIDGRYNMHKIISSGTINITIPANVGQYTYSLTHGLGYKPCIAAYYDNLDENFITPFPVMHLGNYAGIIGQGYLITFLGRVAITPTTLEFVFSKEGYYTAAEQHLLVRYYIYKEVAI